MTLKSLNEFSRKFSYFPNYSIWIFLLVIFTISIIYNYQHILFLSPQSLHQWRQCDCLSLTMNYYQDNNNFFTPAVHHLGGDGTGKTVSDFPVIYFTVAQLWKVFGQHEFILRLINLLLFFTGITALFKTVETILKDSFIAVFSAALLFTSPILVYYSNNFLMDVPAFSLALVGLCFFTQFFIKQKNKYFLLFGACFALAGLLKISSMLSFMGITILFIAEIAGIKFREKGKIFNQPLRQGLVIISVYVILLSWYLYAKSYNEKYNAGNFLLGILPIWKFDHQQINEMLKAVVENSKWAYFYRATQLLFVMMLLIIIVKYKKIKKPLMLLTILIAAGFGGFLVLFFQALAHDYYVVNMLILVPFILVTFLLLMKESYQRIYYSFIFRILLVAFLVHNIDFARRRMNDRYNAEGWQNAEYIKHNKAFEEIKPYLATLGIQQADRVISLSDNSINITLYLMNQKGWTNYGLNADSTLIAEKISMGAKYLFIYDKEIYKNKTIETFTRKKIGEFKGIDIYKLQAVYPAKAAL